MPSNTKRVDEAVRPEIWGSSVWIENAGSAMHGINDADLLAGVALQLTPKRDGWPR